LTLTNDATIKTSYDVEITILTTDGTNDMYHSVSITINVVCGPSSTILTTPAMAILKQAPNLATLLSISGTVENLNPTCPITSYSLITGEGDFDLVGQDTDFGITMTDSANAVEAIYTYLIEVKAEGEAVTQIEGSMSIEKACKAWLNTDFELSYSFDIPEFDSVVENFPSSSVDYISEPAEPDSSNTTPVECE
jgi:hypothetical protein